MAKKAAETIMEGTKNVPLALKKASESNFATKSKTTHSVGFGGKFLGTNGLRYQLMGVQIGTKESGGVPHVPVNLVMVPPSVDRVFKSGSTGFSGKAIDADDTSFRYQIVFATQIGSKPKPTTVANPVKRHHKSGKLGATLPLLALIAGGFYLVTKNNMAE